jgi:hypothetical protein
VDHTVDIEHRRPVEIGRPGGVVVLVWSALIIELGILAMAVGWVPGAPVSAILAALLWPGSLVAFVALGALPRRGGLLLGLVGGLLVGLTCAIVVSVLPDALLPLSPPTVANRVYTIIQAVWATPVVGMALAAVGIGLRRVVLRRIAAGTPTTGAPVRTAAVNDAFARRETESPGVRNVSAGSTSGYAPVGLAIAAGAAVSLAAVRASSERTPAPR